MLRRLKILQRTIRNCQAVPLKEDLARQRRNLMKFNGSAAESEIFADLAQFPLGMGSSCAAQNLVRD